MIPRTVPSWQRELSQSIRDPAELLLRLKLGSELLEDARHAAKLFGLYVSPAYLSRIEVGNLSDPLLRQVLPLSDELIEQRGFSMDPVDEFESFKAPGLLQKYHGRALLITTAACAINCRYCFRRHFPYQGSAPTESNWQEVLKSLREDDSISELILSGGDPLLITNERLAGFLDDLETITHLKRVRIHSRIPIVLPSRIDAELCQILASSRLFSVVIIHANHSNEIDDEVSSALRRLRPVATLLNQSVLLKGVNDSAATLSELSEQLFANGVLPYYLHQLDRVQGAAHFEVTDGEALTIHQTMSESLPGYLLPKLVREVAGKQSKTPLIELFSTTFSDTDTEGIFSLTSMGY
ncbi:EF-P beta-lysylation protein EpmB [Candidatus Reidiella endopervernicosa]|nr:EF-P beta-lysylation protein EpmB [Candidatus Reidiella endopervernicosa]QKQ27400.1 EF-P beta-lysylation protein EpmB [Candidatus Reidiella endopervernicosa]